MRKLLLLALISIAVSSPASARDGDPENWCRNGAFPRESGPFTLVKVTGAAGDKAYIQGDSANDCPNQDSKLCPTKKYLIPGDLAIKAKEYETFSCIWYQPKKNKPEVVGWVATANLANAAAKPDTLKNWLGTWQVYDNELVVKQLGAKRLGVTGNASWGTGASVNVGEIDDEATPSGNVLQLPDNSNNTDDSCAAKLTLLGDYLIVSDNMRCGGMNVTFSGVYFRH